MDTNFKPSYIDILKGVKYQPEQPQPEQPQPEHPQPEQQLEPQQQTENSEYLIFLEKQEAKRKHNNERQRLNYQKRKDNNNLKSYYEKKGYSRNKNILSLEEFKQKQNKPKEPTKTELLKQIEALKALLPK